MNIKKCTKCNIDKPKTKFRYRGDVKDNLQSWCRECENKANRERYVPAPKKNKKIKKEDPVKVKSNARDRMLRHRYGITLDDYNRMYKDQDGKCKICLEEYNNGGYGGLYVDHCHDSGNVRGLLCPRCNSLLGRFLDDIDLIMRAIEYINKHR